MRNIFFGIAAILICTPLIISVDGQHDPPSQGQLGDSRTLGFPQRYAQILCDRPDLKVSVYNSDSSLYLQAILWTDDDDAPGKQKDGKDIGDYSSLLFHFGNGPQRVPEKDKNYTLNPWPSMRGLYFSTIVGEHTSTALKKDMEDRGVIQHITTADGKRVRVDSYLIPLSDLGLVAGDSISLCYYAYSPAPELTLNSTKAVGKGRYYGHQIPVSAYKTIRLQKGNPVLFERLPKP